MHLYKAQFLSFRFVFDNNCAVSRRKPLAAEEIEICRRVRMVREAKRISRPIFGRFLALDSSKVSNIENFRVPLDYITGNRICRIFQVSPRWLTTGQGAPRQFLPVSVYSPIHGATGRTSFREAYSRIEKRIAEAERKIPSQLKAIGQHFMERASKGHSLSHGELNRLWQEAIHATGSEEQADIDAQLSVAAFDPRDLEFENELAIVAGFDDKRPMSNVTIPSDLIGQVQALTQQRGAKSKLARETLHVSRQRLNEWLSGRATPSARYLLLLLNWAGQQKQQTKKRAAPAETGTALKTKSKSKYEKAKDRKKE